MDPSTSAYCNTLQHSATPHYNKLHINRLDMWAMDTSTLAFFKVALNPDTLGPRSTFLASMVAASEFAGYKEPLVLAGGADVTCASNNPPCTVPTPSNEIWVMDTARKESVGTGSTFDGMAELDGEDDMLQIVLPDWCNRVTMMNVLWIDSWLLVMSTGKVKTILFDAYSGAIPRLRWYMEGTDSGNYIKLVLSPGNTEKVVKSWGPLSASFLGTWHHIALTLRTARQYSRTSSDPAVIITQAFMFVDGKNISGGDNFATINLKKDLMFESGLSQIFVGGTSPERKSSRFRNLKGAVDNVRVWWPPCPHISDPTKCNPYGFIYPQMVDGTRQPAAGVTDNQVTLKDVAMPILTSMFSLATPGTDGLLAQFHFNDPVSDGMLTSSSSWTGPMACGANGVSVYRTCND